MKLFYRKEIILNDNLEPITAKEKHKLYCANRNLLEAKDKYKKNF